MGLRSVKDSSTEKKISLKFVLEHATFNLLIFLSANFTPPQLPSAIIRYGKSIVTLEEVEVVVRVYIREVRNVTFFILIYGMT